MLIEMIFYLFATVLIAAAVSVITVKNPVQAALFLILAFFSSAAIWLLLQAEFLAIALILVYVGAVMVLFLFVVMMLDINLSALQEEFVRYRWTGFAVGVVVLIEMLFIFVSFQYQNYGVVTEDIAVTANNTKVLGQALYTTYVYPFEIAAAILLVAMVAAIALTLRPHDRAKYQKPEQQVAARREERVRLVKMPAEPKD